MRRIIQEQERFQALEEQQQEVAAAITVVVPTIDFTFKMGKLYLVTGTFQVGASPLTYTTGGIPVNFGSVALVKSQTAPIMVMVVGQCVQAAQTEYDYTFIPGSNNTNGLMKIFTAGAEIAAAAIPAGVSGDTIQFMALFLGQN